MTLKSESGRVVDVYCAKEDQQLCEIFKELKSTLPLRVAISYITHKNRRLGRKRRTVNSKSKLKAYTYVAVPRTFPQPAGGKQQGTKRKKRVVKVDGEPGGRAMGTGNNVDAANLIPATMQRVRKQRSFFSSPT